MIAKRWVVIAVALAGVAAVTALAVSAQPYGMMGGGYGYGPGAMMGGGYGQGPGYMMGQGMGQGMMGGGYGYGPGQMMGPGMMGGYGYGPGAMRGYGPGYRGDLNITVDQAKNHIERMVAIQGNTRLKVGDVKEKDADTIVADIVTKDGNALVQRFTIDRRNGFMQPE